MSATLPIAGVAFNIQNGADSIAVGHGDYIGLADLDKHRIVIASNLCHHERLVLLGRQILDVWMTCWPSAARVDPPRDLAAWIIGDLLWRQRTDPRWLNSLLDEADQATETASNSLEYADPDRLLLYDRSIFSGAGRATPVFWNSD